MTSSSGGGGGELSSNDNELTLEVKKIFWESLLHSVIDVITKCDSSVYYKVRQGCVTKCDSYFITKCDRGVLQSATAILLQSVIEVITKCDRYYKV